MSWLWWLCKVVTQGHKKTTVLHSLFTLGYPTYILHVMWLREDTVSEQKKICRLLCFVCESLNSIKWLKEKVNATAFACNTCTETPAAYLQHPMWWGGKMQQNQSGAAISFIKALIPIAAPICPQTNEYPYLCWGGEKHVRREHRRDCSDCLLKGKKNLLLCWRGKLWKKGLNRTGAAAC